MYKMANFMQKIQDLIFFKLQKKKKNPNKTTVKHIGITQC